MMVSLLLFKGWNTLVAKTYQAYEIIDEPFEANKKMYVQVRNPKNKNIKTVRWYNATEYAKLYPEEKTVVAENGEKSWPNLKKVLGFEKGYITIYKGVNDYNEDWIARCKETRYHDRWGWYTISTEQPPATLPEGVEPEILEWEKVAINDTTLKSKDEVRQVVHALL